MDKVLVYVTWLEGGTECGAIGISYNIEHK